MFLFDRDKDKPLRFTLNEAKFDDLSVEDLIAFEAVVAAGQGEEVPFHIRDTITFMSKFMVNEKGEQLPSRVAVRRLKKLKSKEFQDLLDRFNAALEAAQEEAVPKDLSDDSR
jgi:hypothetical protein